MDAEGQCVGRTGQLPNHFLRRLDQHADATSRTKNGRLFQPLMMPGANLLAQAPCDNARSCRGRGPAIRLAHECQNQHRGANRLTRSSRLAVLSIRSWTWPQSCRERLRTWRSAPDRNAAKSLLRCALCRLLPARFFRGREALRLPAARRPFFHVISALAVSHKTSPSLFPGHSQMISLLRLSLRPPETSSNPPG
jgi:hypothetical protein